MRLQAKNLPVKYRRRVHLTREGVEEMENDSLSAGNRSPWIKKRHGIIRLIFGPVVAMFTRLLYGIRAERFKEQGSRPYLILYNHQTPFDQFYVMMSFRGPVYYVASEDIFSIGWAASLLRWAVAPIPIKKQAADVNAVRLMMKVAKEGGTIALAPEGNRTYSGKTEYMIPTIARLAKKMKLPIALYRIEGGYGVQPRWSDGIRKGPFRSFVSEVIEPEQYLKMTDEALMDAIREGLYVNEAETDGRYRSKKKAEYLERAVYVCPFCGFSVFKSSGDRIECTGCHRKILYGEDKRLRGDGSEFPFAYVNDWYEYQKNYVNAFDPLDHTEEPLFTDSADLYEVIPYKRKRIICENTNIRLYGDRVEIREGDPAKDSPDRIFPFKKVSGATVLGRNKLNLYYDSEIFQIKGGRRFNALKYVNFCYRYKNRVSEEENGEFLGL